MAERSGLLASAHDKAFDETILKWCKKSAENEIKVVFLSLSSKENEGVCRKLVTYTTNCLKKLGVIEEEDQDVNVNAEAPMDVECDAAEMHVTRLRGVAMMSYVYSTECADSKPKALLNVIQLLHDALIPLDEGIAGVISLKNTISRVCEYWWTHDQVGAENLIPQLLPYLLVCSLSPESTDADIKRVYAIRLSLLLLDFDDESIDSVKTLLLQCLTHPPYLKLSEGRKFLAFLFSIGKRKWTVFNGFVSFLHLCCRLSLSVVGSHETTAWKCINNHC